MRELNNCDCSSRELAMGSFVMQEWCEPYENSLALCHGTIFPCLDKKFYVTEDFFCPTQEATDIYEIGFALVDLRLYLDTHPDCEKGRQYQQELLEKLAETRKGNCGTEVCGDWDACPMPWEGGMI